MSKLQQALKDTHKLIMDNEPDTMDGLLSLVLNSGLLRDYGFGTEIVHYKGAIQGVVVTVRARTKQYILPGHSNVYAIHKGLEKFLESHWTPKTMEEIEE